MKKSKLEGLSLKKNVISKLNGSTIKGGNFSIDVLGPDDIEPDTDECNCFPTEVYCGPTNFSCL